MLDSVMGECSRCEFLIKKLNAGKTIAKHYQDYVTMHLLSCDKCLKKTNETAQTILWGIAEETEEDDDQPPVTVS